ncbi:MAG: methyltransferase domain-containing protein [Patescibacteria group bacterium]
MRAIPIGQHDVEIKKNFEYWQKKPLLREIYLGFYKRILGYIRGDINGEIVELGSGIGNFKMACPEAVATDLFPNPLIDRVESVYHLTSNDSTASNFVLFDVFHHLKYPGFALKELHRALAPHGRVIIFDPCISLLGFLVYGLFHHEPVAWRKKIEWLPVDLKENLNSEYYAAQGNATRIFKNNSEFMGDVEKDWKVVAINKYADVAYVLSGGFSKPALIPKSFLPFFRLVEKFLGFFPIIFATRILIVLEKK